MKTVSLFALVAALAASSRALAVDTDMFTTVAQTTSMLFKSSVSPPATLSKVRRDDARCFNDDTFCKNDRGPVVYRLMEAITVDVDENHKNNFGWDQGYTGNQTVACVKGEVHRGENATEPPFFCAQMLEANETYSLFGVFDMLFRMAYMDHCAFCGKVPEPGLAAELASDILLVNYRDDAARKGCEGLCSPGEI